ncbi:MAG: histidinol-phosphate transaminase [Candidatus Thiodiazotropha sp. (ex Gloverina cf. vestifex)]|nr:histidinol-phosphate transaminase [Candidatus Thiodiazotropha sp. (ex Gloverina cf. vestifex)]
MSRYWSPVINQLSPYIPGEQPKIDDLVKLNTNENPYGPSPRVIEAIQNATDERLRLYPDPTGLRLRETVADYHSLKPEQIFIGNGSDEVLAHAFFALFRHSQPLLFPDITYSFYPVYCGLYGIDYRTVPLADDFSLRLSDYDTANGGIIFPNPNAPTGRLLPLSEIESLLSRNTDSVVAVDEAYIDFGGESASRLINFFPNLLVVQTLSKSRSLAGLRIGLAMGDSALIEGLIRVKDSFNSYPIDRLALAASVASYEDDAYFREITQRVIDDRKSLNKELAGMGFEVIPSSANFVFVRHATKDADNLAAGLREASVIVRHFKQPRIEQYLRITVGTAEQNQRLIEALNQLM